MDTYGVIDLRKSELFFETLALVAFVITVGVLALPAMDGLIMPQEPDEIIIRMYVQEYLGFDSNETVIKKGETVKLVLISMDVAHGFIIPELDINSGIILPGEKKVIEFTPEEEGEYTFMCSVKCSATHSLMRGKIIVEE